MQLSTLSDLELITHFQDILIEEREKLVLQLEYISELDRRKLFFEYSSLWAYLVSERGMEESSAERKIRAARLLIRFPELKALLESGNLNLSLLELALGCAHREKLSDPELLEVLIAIAGMSCRKAKREIASRFPLSSEELPHDRIRPLTDELLEVSFVAKQELLDKLDEVRGLLAQTQQHPMTMQVLIDILATEFIQRHSPVEKAKRAEEREKKKKENEKTEPPSSPKVQLQTESRTPTQAILNELIKRNGYQCSYVDAKTQQRCSSKFALQTHHIIPWSAGGRTELSNMMLICRSHHARISFLEFGESSQYVKSKRE